MGHMLRDFSVYPSGLAGIKQLCITGRELTSGGLISGLLGRLLKSALSAGGGIFLCLLAIIACAFIATGTNPLEFFKALRPSPEDSDEDEEPQGGLTAWMQRRREQKAAKEARKARVAEKAAAQAAASKPAAKTPASTSAPASSPAPAAKPASGRKLTSVGGGFVDFFRKEEEENESAAMENDIDFDELNAAIEAAEKAPVPQPLFFEKGDKLSSEDDLLPFDSVMPPVISPDRTYDPTPAAPVIEFPTPTPAAAPAEPVVSADPIDAPFDLSGAKMADGAPLPADAAFDIFTEDNPPPAELSLDEKRQAASEAHEQAAAENQAAAQLTKTADKAEAGQYIYPPLSLLTPGEPSLGADHESIVRCAERLLDTLKSFNIDATIVNVTKGPTITRYELQLQRGIKFSKVTNLSDDIALALGASAVRIAPIPANNSIGIEVPNDIQETVSLRDVLQNKAFSGAKSKVSFAVGKDIAGQCVVGDIAKMPHMLIAGTTGSGKSVCINSILISLIYKASPEEVRLILVDPKMIELGMYNGVPHLLIPVVTEPKKAAGALNWAVG
ncbi:MAG: DNA translocase FtsK, partial [Clostridia bacterium]|nr:DNA translocase FtsK [Clostridia bacterium]